MQKRHTLVFMTFLAVFICYIDRVNISVAIIPMVEKFGWDLSTQGLVLSSFYLGYLLLQVVGGRLADRFGGKIVLGMGVVLWSLFTLITPPAAAFGITALIITRVLMGMGEAVMFPSMYSLFARWVPQSERSRSTAFATSGISLGTVFALLVTPIIVTHLGWEWSFYLFGLAGLLWFGLWQRLIAPSPRQHRGISAAELTFIEEHTAGAERAPHVPWKQLFCSMPVWAIIVSHFCNNWSLYVLLSWLPTFVNKGLGVDMASVGVFAMVPHITSFVFLNVAGNVADRWVSGGMDITRVRKTMMTIGFGGMTIALMLVGLVDSPYMAIGIMSVGTALNAFVAGGFWVNHMDVAPKHAGTLMGITNTAGTVPGVLGVIISGWILQETNSWTMVFQVAGGVTLFGLVFYLVFGSGKRHID